MIEYDPSRPFTEPPNFKDMDIPRCCETCMHSNAKIWCDKHQYSVHEAAVCDDYL